MIIKDNGTGDYLTGTFDDVGSVSMPSIDGLIDYPVLTDPTTGLPSQSADDSIFFITGFGEVLETAGQSIAGSLGPILQNVLNSIFKPAPTTTVTAKPTSTGVSAESPGISTNMLLIGALAIGGYYILSHK